MSLRGLFQIVASWVFTIVLVLAVAVLVLGTLGRFSHRLSPFLMRLWGRTLLRFARVTYEVQGREHLETDAMKIVPFNHGSLLDAYLVTAIMPPGSVAALKREVLFYPFVGLGAVLLGFLLLDRRRPSQAHGVLGRAAARMEKERLTVFISPEGTREKLSGLLPFKKGAMSLALDSHAPIVPMLIDGAWELQGPGRLTSTPGHVVMRFLPPRPTQGLTHETIGAETEGLHALFVRELARLRAERGAARMLGLAFAVAPVLLCAA